MEIPPVIIPRYDPPWFWYEAEKGSSTERTEAFKHVQLLFFIGIL